MRFINFATVLALATLTQGSQIYCGCGFDMNHAGIDAATKDRKRTLALLKP